MPDSNSATATSAATAGPATASPEPAAPRPPDPREPRGGGTTTTSSRAADVAVRYGVALVVVTLAVLIKLLLIPHVGQDAPSLLFFASVMASAWYGGFGPGCVATILAAVCSNYFFKEPYYTLGFSEPSQRWRLLLFIFEGVFISVLCDRLNAARRRAEAADLAARNLERRIIAVSEAQQRQIGHDLHDGLGQHLTGVAFMSRLLSRRLEQRGVPEAAEASKIEELVNKSVSWTRTLAAGLAPVEIDAGDLPSALRQLAMSTEEIFPTRCAVRFDDRWSSQLSGVATTHLYRIAQEAVSNAVKHGRASHVWLELARRGTDVTLTIRDDGRGVPAGGAAAAGAGMGLQTMAYRARIIGGTLDVRAGESGGTVVACACPASRDVVEPEHP